MSLQLCPGTARDASASLCPRQIRHCRAAPLFTRSLNNRLCYNGHHISLNSPAIQPFSIWRYPLLLCVCLCLPVCHRCCIRLTSAGSQASVEVCRIPIYQIYLGVMSNGFIITLRLLQNAVQSNQQTWTALGPNQSVHLGTVSTYPCFILYIVSKSDQTYETVQHQQYGNNYLLPGTV